MLRYVLDSVLAGHTGQNAAVSLIMGTIFLSDTVDQETRPLIAEAISARIGVLLEDGNIDQAFTDIMKTPGDIVVKALLEARMKPAMER